MCERSKRARSKRLPSKPRHVNLSASTSRHRQARHPTFCSPGSFKRVFGRIYEKIRSVVKVRASSRTWRHVHVKTFQIWMNSLWGNPYVNHLYNDLVDRPFQAYYKDWKPREETLHVQTWMNSLGGSPYVNLLYNDPINGLLQTYYKILETAASFQLLGATRSAPVAWY
ncbi:Hypp4266 [Branchiostoma lanceolatum]|uniref:Hypp4266 protein n=1 Tax=Branchiostoma lanceolatum TaxID=7740 RepID=A0A8K0A7A2_BRALA|nr:Hypp4266 [Branchiostoma lanceolatum]